MAVTVVVIVVMLAMAVVGMAMMMVNEGGDFGDSDDHDVMLMVTEKGM